jgi:hypothetical protein
MKKLERQEPVDFGGVVAIALEVGLDDRFDPGSLQVRAREGSGVEQNFLNVLRENGPIPPPKVEELVTTHPKTFQVKRRK